MKASVQMAGLSKTFRSGQEPVEAVRRLSLTVEPGEIVGLLGPNGAGKTTTIRMLCGLVPPTEGEAYVEGRSVREAPEAIRARIGLVPGEAGHHGRLTILEELAYYGAFYGIGRSEVERRARPLIERLELADRQEHQLRTFSKGMRRKVHLIRALLHEPAVLLLDEPTAGLDPAICEEVWDLLRALAKERGVSVLLCSHHLEEVERLCERVAILQTELLAEGRLDELSGRERVRIGLSGPMDDLDRALSSLDTISDVERAEDGFLVGFDGTYEDVVPGLVRHLVQAGADVLTVERDSGDLRSIYREVVQQAGGETGA